jgi:hypothetical protein
MAEELLIPTCGCADCLAGNADTRREHHQLNLILSRLDEQQRRWVAARETLRLGHGGFKK